MSIVTICRGSYSRGKEVAEKLAEKLGYTCISREVLLEASAQYNIPEFKLVKALSDSTGLERFYAGKNRQKEKYIKTIHAALLEYVKKDNVVYHGLAGQFILTGISHVLKVEILANLEHREKEVMKRENVSAAAARNIIKKVDGERRRWASRLYGIDVNDPNIYDLVLRIDTLSIDEVIDILISALQSPDFQATEESKKKLDNMALVAKAHASLLNYSDAQISFDQGKVTVAVKIPLNLKEKVVPEIKNIVKRIEGVNQVEVKFGSL